MSYLRIFSTDLRKAREGEQPTPAVPQAHKPAILDAPEGIAERVREFQDAHQDGGVEALARVWKAHIRQEASDAFTKAHIPAE